MILLGVVDFDSVSAQFLVERTIEDVFDKVGPSRIEVGSITHHGSHLLAFVDALKLRDNGDVAKGSSASTTSIKSAFAALRAVF
jgi:hypothetical protein